MNPRCLAGSLVWALHDRDFPVHMARRVTEQTLGRWRLPKTSETAALVVSELVTNATQHACPPVELTLALFAVSSQGKGGSSSIQIDVRDGAATMPMHKSGGSEGGFGLTVVAALADLSFHPHIASGSGGKVVRAVLPITDSEARHATVLVPRADVGPRLDDRFPSRLGDPLPTALNPT